MSNKETILTYLEQAHTGASAVKDLEMMCRLNRAIVAFSYDDFETPPDWQTMVDAYITKG